MAPSVKPLHVFRDIAEFAKRHKAGTEAEFEATQKLVDAINKENNKFQAWILSKTRQTSKRSEYLIIVNPGPDAERKIPQQGEPAKLRVVFGDNSVTRFWDARRVENPQDLLSAIVRRPEKLATFHVTVHIADAHDGLRPLIDTTATNTGTTSHTSVKHTTSGKNISGTSSSDSSDSGIGGCSNTETTVPEGDGPLALTSDNTVWANFLLTASEATKNAELNALDQLCGRYINASERQIKAFEYFVLLRDAEFFVDLHEQIPHLKSVMDHPSWKDSPLGKRFALLNPQQKAAYMHGFRKLLCGICILPGGPGAGKTHFNLFTIAMAQSQPLPRPLIVKGRPERRCAKVLFIVDMNSPVDDVANRMTAVYKDIGMEKSIIRMKGWGAEVRSSDRLNAAEDAASGEEMHIDFSSQFLRTINSMSLRGSSDPVHRSCQAPSLDEAAWQRYDKFKDSMYAELTEYLAGELWENSDIIPLRFRRLVYNLYRDTLAAADFIATTPVAASNHFQGMFKPDLVYFDEAPHARELTNLIAIANFDPIAWVFCGDHRQTVPYVGSAAEDSANVYREQMQVSMMERAAVSNAIRFELLMNHRSFGGLHQLASTMWYNNRMVSGNEGHTPASLCYTRRFLEGFMGGRTCTVPRLLVHLKNCGPEGRDGTSAWNPTHVGWIMSRVHELINDSEFRHAELDEPGTILIISPYRKAFMEYQKAIKHLPHWAQRRVETRTVDVVQGHEADFVFLDLVKDKSTTFLDNPNRLCVAVTRARVGEIIVMHPDMVQSTTFNRHSQNLRPIYNLCKKAGQVAFVDPSETLSSSPCLTLRHPAERNSAITGAASNLTSKLSRPATPAENGPHSKKTLAQPIPNATVNAQINQKTVPLAGAVARMTRPGNDVCGELPVRELRSVTRPVITPTVGKGQDWYVADIDDGERWWNSVSGSTAESTVRLDHGSKVEGTASPLLGYDDKVLEVPEVSEASGDQPQEQPIITLQAVTPTVGTEQARHVADIDDCESWWKSVNGSVAKSTVRCGQGSEVEKNASLFPGCGVEKLSGVSEDVNVHPAKKTANPTQRLSVDVEEEATEKTGELPVGFGLAMLGTLFVRKV